LLCAAAAATGVSLLGYGDPDSRASGSQVPGVINAVDFDFVNPANGEPRVEINAGETVTFAYPEGGSVHNVDFLTIEPTSCVQTAGPVVGDVPPLPSFRWGRAGPATDYSTRLARTRSSAKRIRSWWATSLSAP
jgi:hypothetical protein